MLETHELTKTFKGITAVDQVNMYLGKGESVGLLGPNGAGKSTTISMISTLMKATTGHVLLNGQKIGSETRSIRSILGVVPQEIALYEDLSAYENLQFFGRIYGLKGSDLKARIEDRLDLVGLTDRKHDLIKTYSGGMKRRINIACALLHDPEILIMDEPTVGIDPQSRTYILDMVRQLNEEKGMTILYTSHYMEEVERLCDRIYIMDHGQIIANGTNDELKRILSNEEAIYIDIDAPNPVFTKQLSVIEGIRQVTDTDDGIKLIVDKGTRKLPDIFQLADALSVNVLNVRVEIPTLEDVFLHLTGRTLRD
ncbi:ABC transporter ATP-binding protein [Salisediminibacterium selenitireducens]|uniref:ABC transporter related protein n=1 Tax=Bacillus selenitireducens (strain ATCC 700615 / DSM 15326 / MLS10) TaxID=439292 RepID=D6XWI8_BACIE|nr:ABC transporter ATP-binding protein [Salisediminibacterium selenitireducens]ADH97830.1 ABC transporter related protein [[Bacillus] selenitireducens MLS10]